MLRKRFSLTVLDIVALLCALALLVGLNVWQLNDAPRADVADRPTRPPQTQRMPDQMQLWYDRWTRRTKDVSVFARGATAYGWVTGYLDLDSAKADALAWCARSGVDCRVVEVQEDLTEINGVDVPLTGLMATRFARFVMTPGPVAFAASDTGAFASVKGETPQAAQARALAVCAQYAAKDREAFLPSYPCRVIATR